MAKRVFKTVRKLAGQKNFRKWEDWSLGDILIGEYVGIHNDQYGHDCPVLKVLDAQFKKESEGDKLLDKELVLNACGALDKAMEGLQIGQIIQVTYNGKAAIEKGIYKGKEAHSLSIDLVEEESEEIVEDILDEDI